MTTFVREGNTSRREVRTDHFHGRNSVWKHQVSRLQFSSGFQLLQFLDQFRMQRTGLLFTILDEFGRQHPIRIGRIHVKIASM
ncbi:MAG TPA: hypothetical protein VMF08_17190 [Candidatus Sulfotelmatobacter sp.]|nr:hypothetical protein [Candidatus Sulfotelmatobacter sp.]